MHPITPKTPTPQSQLTEGRKRKRKQQKPQRERAAQANKGVLTLFLKPASPTQSDTVSPRSSHRDTEWGIKVMRHFGVLQRGGAGALYYCVCVWGWGEWEGLDTVCIGCYELQLKRKVAYWSGIEPEIKETSADYASTQPHAYVRLTDERPTYYV